MGGIGGPPLVDQNDIPPQHPTPITPPTAESTLLPFTPTIPDPEEFTLGIEGQQFPLGAATVTWPNGQKTFLPSVPNHGLLEKGMEEHCPWLSEADESEVHPNTVSSCSYIVVPNSDQSLVRMQSMFNTKLHIQFFALAVPIAMLIFWIAPISRTLRQS